LFKIVYYCGMMEKIPIIINNYNLLTFPREMINALLKWQNISRIIIVDNNSNYTPLLNYYEALKLKDKITIIRMKNNLGHHAPWAINLPKMLHNELKCRYYVVTDPDLDISHLPPDTLEQLYNLYLRLPYGNYEYRGRAGDPFLNAKIPFRTKIGLGIRTDDIPEGALFFTNMERRYNEQPVTNGVLCAPLDTTFAIYDTIRGFAPGIGGVRTIAPLLCRHLPYYYTAETLGNDDEYINYLNTANYSSSTKQRRDGIGETAITE